MFSAHGVPKAVPVAAAARGLNYLDATCPLVSKVHRQAERLVAQGRHILFIGHAGHPEVIGTFGQVPPGTMTLVETLDDAQAVSVAEPDNVGFLTQTTLSVDDTAAIVAELQRRFPAISRAQGRGHLLRDVEPPGGGQADRAAVRPRPRHRRGQLVELAAAARGRRAVGDARDPDPVRRRPRLGVVRRGRKSSA